MYSSVGVPGRSFLFLDGFVLFVGAGVVSFVITIADGSRDTLNLFTELNLPFREGKKQNFIRLTEVS